uniref:Integrase_H2C2 domain-containing protein n=1 Tax=Heligmosomoides polygyrus TaxID=6339 RepID=A0A183F816_HELPZ
LSKAAKHFGTPASELQTKANVILFRTAQMESPPTNDLLIQLGLFTCKKTGLFRVQTRIQNSTLPAETKQPSNITALYILFIHEKNQLAGTEHTLTQLRQSLWISKGRAVVKRVINNRCFVCKRLNAKPFRLPDYPTHPHLRVQKPNCPLEN